VATRFRNDLLDHGFLMIHSPFIARRGELRTIGQTLGHHSKLVPAAGNVRMLFLTDEQWEKM